MVHNSNVIHQKGNAISSKFIIYFSENFLVNTTSKTTLVTTEQNGDLTFPLIKTKEHYTTSINNEAATISNISSNNEESTKSSLIELNLRFRSSPDKDSSTQIDRNYGVSSTKSNNGFAKTISPHRIVSNKDTTQSSFLSKSYLATLNNENFGNRMNRTSKISKSVTMNTIKGRKFKTLLPINGHTSLTQPLKSNTPIEILDRNRNMKMKSVLKTLLNRKVTFDNYYTTMPIKGNKTTDATSYKISTAKSLNFTLSSRKQEHISEQTILIAMSTTYDFDIGVTSVMKRHPVVDHKRRREGKIWLKFAPIFIDLGVYILPITNSFIRLMIYSSDQTQSILVSGWKFCKDEGYGDIRNWDQCRKVSSFLTRKRPSHSMPIRFSITSSPLFLPGCIYDSRGSKQLFWNKKNKKHPDKNVNEWCSKHKTCKRSYRICISVGKNEFLTIAIVQQSNFHHTMINL